MRSILTAAAFATLASMGSYTSFSISSAGFAATTQPDPDEERRRQRQTLSTSVGKSLQEAFDLINVEPPQYERGLEVLNRLAARDGLEPYDRSTILEIRGGVYAALSNYQASLRDYVEVLRIDALPFERLKQIRYNVAQLYFVNEDYAQAIRFMREYLGQAGTVEEPNAWYILAAAYVSQGDYRNARGPAENVVKFDKKKEKKNFDLLNLIYSELGLNVERGRLLEQMIEYFPNEEGYWAQLSGAYAQAGRDQDAFATLEVSYKAGLLKGEDKIVALAQYYSALENPFRGAKLIEAEMANGVVKQNLRNFELLAQLWSMARNQPKAIAALTEAAKLSDKGELFYRLGQSFMADEQFEIGVRNLRLALQKGGLTSRDRGDIYLLLGAALMNIDDDTKAGRAAARAEFVRAANFDTARREARGWIEYIDAIEDTLRRQDEVERLQREEARRREIERCESIIDVAELGGQVDNTRLAECRVLVAQAEVEEASSEDDAEVAPEVDIPADVEPAPEATENAG